MPFHLLETYIRNPSSFFISFFTLPPRAKRRCQPRSVCVFWGQQGKETGCICVHLNCLGLLFVFLKKNCSPERRSEGSIWLTARYIFFSRTYNLPVQLLTFLYFSLEKKRCLERDKQNPVPFSTVSDTHTRARSTVRINPFPVATVNSLSATKGEARREGQGSRASSRLVSSRALARSLGRRHPPLMGGAREDPGARSADVTPCQRPRRARGREARQTPTTAPCLTSLSPNKIRPVPFRSVPFLPMPSLLRAAERRRGKGSRSTVPVPGALRPGFGACSRPPGRGRLISPPNWYTPGRAGP
jgi:hypothetical protein